jgi:hypothetical protein
MRWPPAGKTCSNFASLTVGGGVHEIQPELIATAGFCLPGVTR